VFTKPIVTVKLVSRTCGWCGVPLPYSGTGRPRSYCCKSHRNRAWAVRSGAARAGDGTRTPGPVREILERTTTMDAPASASGDGPAWPLTAVEWCAMLGHLTGQLRVGRLGREHWHHRKILDAMNEAAAALDTAHPGGLDNITGHRR
jgi:hypothetical protein